MRVEENENVDDFLEHFGIKGMKWGVRKDDYSGATRKTNREAKKDASEYARAKMFYGEGAGNRRKLIKATVDAKAKHDPAYKQAFDHHLERQAMDRHAEKARSERKRKDARAQISKNARAVNRHINGPFAGPVLSAAVFDVAVYAHAKGYDKQLIDAGKEFYRKNFA